MTDASRVAVSHGSVRDERRRQANTLPSPGKITVMISQGKRTLHERQLDVQAQAHFDVRRVSPSKGEPFHPCLSSGALFPSRVRDRRLILAFAMTVYGGRGLEGRGPIQLSGLRRALHNLVGRQNLETAPAA